MEPFRGWEAMENTRDIGVSGDPSTSVGVGNGCFNDLRLDEEKFFRNDPGLILVLVEVRLGEFCGGIAVFSSLMAVLLELASLL